MFPNHDGLANHDNYCKLIPRWTSGSDMGPRSISTRRALPRQSSPILEGVGMKSWFLSASILGSIFAPLLLSGPALAQNRSELVREMDMTALADQPGYVPNPTDEELDVAYQRQPV